jgi:hypothetical protein
MSPIQAERRARHTSPLKAVQDRVLALDGEYRVSTSEDHLLHHIVFRQKELPED